MKTYVYQAVVARGGDGADAALYERGDLDGMRSGAPVDGRPGADGDLGGEVDFPGVEPTKEWMQAFVDREMMDGAGWDGALDALARAIGLEPGEGD